MIPMTFHVDCGECLDGRFSTATGLRVDGVSDDKVHADDSERTVGRPVHPMVSLTYRITPALPPSRDGRGIYATVRLDPPLDAAHWDNELVFDAGLRTSAGATSSGAAAGPFVLPDSTREVTVHLVETTIVSRSAGHRDAASVEPDRDLGHIVVDLSSRTATWQPADPLV